VTLSPAPVFLAHPAKDNMVKTAKAAMISLKVFLFIFSSDWYLLPF
jgi:hypothetical protein